MSLGQVTGVSKEEIEVISSDDYMTSEHLTPREKACVLWAEHVTKNTAKYRDDIFAEVAKQFSEPEIVELTLICSYRNMRTRLHDALQIDLDPREDLESVITGSQKQSDADKLKAYLEVLIENWPKQFPKAPIA